MGPGAGSSDNVGHITVWDTRAVAEVLTCLLLTASGHSLDQHTGDGKSDGETFLGRTWMFFLRGVGEGKRKCQDSTAESFSQDDTHFQTVPFFMLYIIY